MRSGFFDQQPRAGDCSERPRSEDLITHIELGDLGVHTVTPRAALQPRLLAPRRSAYCAGRRPEYETWP